MTDDIDPDVTVRDRPWHDAGASCPADEEVRSTRDAVAASPPGRAEHAPRDVVLGVGLRASATRADVLAAAREALLEAGLDPSSTSVATLATWNERVTHPGLQDAATLLRARLVSFDAATLAAQPVSRPSARVARLTGPSGPDRCGSSSRGGAVSSVAEASALAATDAGGALLLARYAAHGCVVAVATFAAASTPPADEIHRDEPSTLRAAPVPAVTCDDSEDRPERALKHHGDAETGEGLVDFAVNVAVSSPPNWLTARLQYSLNRLAAYPDPRPAETAVATILGVDPSCVLALNGVAEGFTLVARSHPWRRPLVVHPQFTEPEAALRDAGFDVVRHVLTPASAFTLDAQHVDREADLVFVGNPTNPTSRLHERADLLALRRQGRLVVVDEAFGDVATSPAGVGSHRGAQAAGGHRPPGFETSVVDDAVAAPGLLVFRSLTKTFGLAGLRAGYALAHPSEIAALRAVQSPWSVNAMALEAMRLCHGAGEGEAERAADHVIEVAAQVAARRPGLVATLRRRGLSVVADPAAPFVLAAHPYAAQLRLRLRDRGVAVRRGDTFPGLGPTWLRFAVRDAATVARLDAALGDSLPHLVPKGPVHAQEQR